ncbi:MAG TPA: glycosyltransferase [Roseiflexaceae bacterium]|nr:glycosyltransferase [Roseiflexaceae bacterium]
MRILLLSKAMVVGSYQKKAEELAALPDVELTVAIPPVWLEPGVGPQPLERRFTCGYDLVELPIRLNGRHHLHYFPTLGELVAKLRPDIFHIDEESFNLATFLAMRAGVRYGARCCFYSWATIDRWYPPPFALFERYAFRHAAHAIAGADDAAAILRKHGYRGPLSVLPQFGVDPQLFAPSENQEPRTVFERLVLSAWFLVLWRSKELRIDAELRQHAERATVAVLTQNRARIVGPCDGMGSVAKRIALE